MLTFEKLLDNIEDLPIDQQELLMNIVSHRLADKRRQQLAQECQEGLVEFRSGQLKPMTAEEAIADLHNFLAEPE
ncbi:hypothetical protein H6G45_00635 [Synechocystis sp. FACHB-383]|nr:hypothetical protein [Synechocystis sp. LEGE 06083]MBD2652019.1 hypothetical protein [Synechocystis sp. FACHB-383]MBE9194006.1 hypothetical protein [Synechocystis sp. LEGE 06083]